jgi:predicted HicB family RNase H-like nuclease
MDHGNKGNKHAQKGSVKADSFLHVRIDKSRKANYVKAAQRRNIKLSAWVIETLDNHTED